MSKLCKNPFIESRIERDGKIDDTDIHLSSLLQGLLFIFVQYEELKNCLFNLTIAVIIGVCMNNEKIICQTSRLFPVPEWVTLPSFKWNGVNAHSVPDTPEFLLSSAGYIHLAPSVPKTGIKTRYPSDFIGLYTFTGPDFTFVTSHAWWQNQWPYGIGLLLILVLLAMIRQYEHKRIESKLKSKQLEEIEKARTIFYTNVTHQFRNPLTVILGMTKEWKNKPAQAANMIERNSRQILRLIHQMLGLSKLESGNLKLQFVKADIVPYLRYLTESFRSYAESKNL